MNDGTQANLADTSEVRPKESMEGDKWFDSEGNLRPIVAPLNPLIDFVSGINASVHVKLVGGFFVGTLLLLGLFILSIMVVHRMSRQVNELNRAQAKVDLARQMQYLVTDQSHLRALALLTNQDSYNEIIVDAKEQFVKDLNTMDILSPKQAEELRSIRELDVRFAEEGARVLALYQEGKLEEAQKLYLIIEHATAQELEGAINQLVSENTGQMTESIAAFRSTQGFIEVMIVTFSLVSLIVVLVVGFVLSWSFTRPVWKIEKVLAEISKGDFSHEVQVKNRDEFGTLGGSINSMSERLQKLYEELQVELSERRRLTETLERRSNQLAAANHELESFSYSVSHDLRAPLRSMDGFSQALIEDYADFLDEEGQDYLRRISFASQRMGELIDDMLTLSRVTRSEMNHEHLDLAELIRSVEQDLRDADPKHKVAFICVEKALAFGDARLLRVLLENLMGNAWKYTGKRANPKIEFGTKEADDEGKVYFLRDNGAGFDMAFIDKLFNPFQRLHPSSEFEGTGIGLATVKRIVNRHGGKVWAEGIVNEGATFYFTLG